MKSYWLPRDDTGKDRQFTNIAGKLGGYKTTFGLSDPDVAVVVADAACFHYILNAQQQTLIYAQALTAYKNNARNGTAGSLGPMPPAPVLGTPPAMVAPGIGKRFTDLVAHLKNHKNYTDAIGRDLQIEGADEQPVDPTTLRPPLTVTQTPGGIVVGWPKQGMDSLEIQVDRGDGKGMVFLAEDSVPDYTDTAPLPAAGQTVLWKYRAVYHLGQERVGLWSEVVSFAVVG